VKVSLAEIGKLCNLTKSLSYNISQGDTDKFLLKFSLSSLRRASLVSFQDIVRRDFLSAIVLIYNNIL